jgi:hypothetical protein
VKRLTSERQEDSSEENNGLLSLSVQPHVHLGTVVVRFLHREFNEGGKTHMPCGLSQPGQKAQK